MLSWLSSIAESIGNLAGNIITGIKNAIIEIFVPSEDFVSDKVESIKDNFGFYTSISDTIEYIKSYFSTSPLSDDLPPSFTLNLSKANSKYDYGSTAVAIDFSWYTPYKPYGDAVVSSIIWLFFAWRVYIHLPSIISGVSGLPDEFKGGKG